MGSLSLKYLQVTVALLLWKAKMSAVGVDVENRYWVTVFNPRGTQPECDSFGLASGRSLKGYNLVALNP